VEESSRSTSPAVSPALLASLYPIDFIALPLIDSSEKFD
jgi:hypothetical protein